MMVVVDGRMDEELETEQQQQQQQLALVQWESQREEAGKMRFRVEKWMSAAASSTRKQSCWWASKVGASNFSALIGLGGCDASPPGGSSTRILTQWQGNAWCHALFTHGIGDEIKW